ncbi:MAG TPA: DEAD/DEAH box helicase [Thermoanaerobacterales bacterium]|nr:DEAD/DEAH box helicase [Thermoanaerobacterales bacterium]
MSLDPLKATDAIVKRYLDYLETTFAFNNKDLQKQLTEELRKQGKFFKGPILEATPPFENGHSINFLIEQGVLSPEFRKLCTPELPLDRNLYMHQEIAIRKLVEERRNIIVATGTGSGKTETFLIPILNHLFQQKEQGRLGPGVRALLLYPMNALANDQLKRLRKLLKNYPEITFGSYTGETEHDESRAVERFKRMNPKEELLPNELLSRERMKESPPHILLTNYAMLEFLLLRPEDHVFFDGEYAKDWRFIVIDEVHTYSGAKGIEMAMLLRRLKDRIVKSKPGALQCIGTSATLGENEKNFKQLAIFGGRLFGEKFEWVAEDPARQDIVIGYKKHLKIAGRSWGNPKNKLYQRWVELVDGKDPDKISKMMEEGLNSGIPEEILKAALNRCEGEWERFIYWVLSGDSRLITLQQMLEKQPYSIAEAAGELFPEDKDKQNNLVALVYLASKAKMDINGQALLPARYHLFIRAVEGGYVSLLPEKRLYMERRELAEGNDGNYYPVFEVATCYRCNSLYLVGELTNVNQHEVLKQPGNRFYDDINNLVYFLLLDDKKPVSEDNEDEIVAEGGEYTLSEENYLLCGKCGSVKSADSTEPFCNCSEEYIFRVIKVPSKNGNVHKCPACGSINSLGSVVRRFIVGAEAITSVLATALYQQIPEQTVEFKTDIVAEDDWETIGGDNDYKSSRRMLIFSDSRQDAAYFASYLQATYNQILRRRLIVMTLEKYKVQVLENQWRVSDLAAFVKKVIYDLHLFPDMSFQQLEQEAWKWVLHEFMAADRILGLEGQGMLGFLPVPPLNWNPPKALCQEPWNLTPDEATTLIMVLLDSVRKNGAVMFPDCVSPSDSFFEPRNKQYYFKDNMKIPGRIYSWNPTDKSHSNARLDYLLRLAKVIDNSITRQNAEEVLGKIWSKLLVGERAPWKNHFSSRPEPRHGDVYILKPEYWRIVPAVIDDSVTWYKCNKCLTLTLHNIRGVCPTYRCNGKLVKCDLGKELASNHYRKLYLDFLPLFMNTSEHTAQLTTEMASRIQKEFYEGRINVLSCSTTFELGVDVGELETVFMRNVPPTAANYIQRAGRAGRRINATGFALTFCQRRSHDFAHYNEPVRIIKGEIRSPHIEISNEKILKRHMYAVALAMFWKKWPEYFGEVNAFFKESGRSATQALRDFLVRRPEELKTSLKRIIPEKLWGILGVDDWSWLEGLLDEKDGMLSRAEAQLMADLRELRAVEEEYKKARLYDKADIIKKTINTLEKRYILNFLSQHNVIPKYGFPVDVVELQIYHHGEEAKGLELNRDLKVALSEYAPESQLIAGGKLWTSRYVKKLPDREPVKYVYAICDYCGYYQSDIADKRKDIETCICGQKIRYQHGVFITPEFGFIAEEPKMPNLSKPQKTYTTRKYFAQEEKMEEEITLNLGAFTIKVQAGEGKLAVINHAGKKGFKICQKCGYSIVNTGRPLTSHKSPWGKPCNGKADIYSLGYEFKTDILRLCIMDYDDRRPGFWESLLYGLLEGACSVLEIERQDVDGTLYPYAGNPYSPALVLFDDVPGGAGHVKRIAEKENFIDILHRTLEIVSVCECGGREADTSCYSCLRNYMNQYCHDRLKRKYVIEFIKKILE